MALLRGYSQSITTSCFYRSTCYHFIGRVVVLCWMAFVCVVPYARWVCLGRIMGRTGRCFPLGHDGGGRLLRYCLSFFFVCLFCFRSVLSDRGCGYMESSLLESLNAAWAHVFLIPAERLFPLCLSKQQQLHRQGIYCCVLDRPSTCRREEKQRRGIHSLQ